MEPLTRSTSYTFKITDRRRISFYAAVFDEPTTVTEKVGGKFVTYRESILPGAFDAALASTDEVIADIDHDPARTFAKRSDGSLILQSDPHGLWCSCWVPEGDAGDQILADVESGKLDGCSFQFSPLKSRTVGDLVERESVELVDVCLTGRPAYPMTEVHLRTEQHRQRSRFLFTQVRLLKLKLSALNTGK